MEIPNLIAVATIIFFICLVLLRSYQLKKLGIKAVMFGKTDKRDFYILPFAFLFVLFVFLYGFHLMPINLRLFESQTIPFLGVIFCLLALALFAAALMSFGKSFRVGIDEDNPGELITAGIFAFSRNPIYTAFGFVLIGIFCIFPNLIFLIYLIAGFFMFHRQVLLEEESLKKIYGEKYTNYCSKVRRYL